MVNNKHSPVDRIVYSKYMSENGIGSYKVVGKVAKVCGYSLLTYGVVTSWLPSGSQLALLGGCALLGIPFSRVWDKVKLYSGRIWYILCVLCSKRRLKYEFNAWRYGL